MTAPHHDPGPGPAPRANIVWAVVSAVLCLPVGVVAVVKAAQVERLWAQGRHDDAHRAAADAQKYAKWAGIVFVMWLVLIVGFQLILGIGGSTN